MNVRLWDCLTCAVAGGSIVAAWCCPYWKLQILFVIMGIAIFLIGYTEKKVKENGRSN